MCGMRNGNRCICWNFEHFHEMCVCVCACDCAPSKWLPSPEKTMRIYKFHMSMYVHTQIFAFFKRQCFGGNSIVERSKASGSENANEVMWRAMPSKGIKEPGVCECLCFRIQFIANDHLEMFVKGVSNCIYSPIIMRPLWIRVLVLPFDALLNAMPGQSEWAYTHLNARWPGIYACRMNKTHVEMQLEVFFNPNKFLNIIVYDCDELSQWDFTSNVEVHVEWHNSTEI